MVVKYMHHGDDLVEHRTRESSFGAQYTNHSANSMCFLLRVFLYINNAPTTQARSRGCIVFDFFFSKPKWLVIKSGDIGGAFEVPPRG